MNDSVEKTEGTALDRESTSSILELVQKEGVRSVRRKIEDRLDRQQEDIEFYIKTNQRPSELVIPTGCVWDAYSYHTRYSEKSELDFAKHNSQYEPVKRMQLPHSVHDRYLIVDDNVWLLGSSVKDIGRGLTTIISTEINPEYILGCVKR